VYSRGGATSSPYRWRRLRRIRLVIAALDAAISLPKNNLPYFVIILNLVLRKLLQNCLCSNIYLLDFEFLRQ
jgi:hypothetical protein